MLKTKTFLDFDNVPNFNQNVNNINNNTIQRNLSITSNQVDLLIFDDNEKPMETTTSKTSFAIPNIVLKILEKTIITLQNGKIKELKIFGQVLLEGDISQNKMILRLINPIWEDSQFLQKRVTPNSLEINQIGASLYEIAKEKEEIKNGKTKSIFDYIVASKHFKIERIPLMVIYKSFESDKHKNDVVLGIQYKVNENPETELKDVEIEAFLDKDIFFDDIQTVPPANSFQNHVLLWKVGHFYGFFFNLCTFSSSMIFIITRKENYKW